MKRCGRVAAPVADSGYSGARARLTTPAPPAKFGSATARPVAPSTTMSSRARAAGLLYIVAAAALLPIATSSYFTTYVTQLFEGNACKMEDGSPGVCKKLPECPMRVREVLTGKRFSTSTGRCSFSGNFEIVCCPLDLVTEPPATTTQTSSFSQKLGLRPADVACHEYENEITGENGQDLHPNIFNGEQAGNGEFPYMVALAYRTDDESQLKHNCGGTLISNRHVITSAHCVNNINNLVPVEVRLGTTSLDDNSSKVQRIAVGEVISHPRYKRSLNYYDIAILKLKKSIEVSENVQPICLQSKPIPNIQALVNMSLIVTGWGATSFGNEGTSQLQKTPSLQMVDKEECSKSYVGFSKLPNGLDAGMMCVLDRNLTRGSDACQGDSGGPLLLRSSVSSTLIGITSFGQSCGSSVPAIYTSVFHYLDWIEPIVWPNSSSN